MVTAGEAWRQFRNGPVTFIRRLAGGAGSLVVILGLLLRLRAGQAARQADRAPGAAASARVDQVVHWSVAISFCILGLSGLIMLFGKHVLLPIIGYTLFGVAHRPRQEPAQLHRAGVHRLDRRAMIVLYAAAQPAQALRPEVPAQRHRASWRRASTSRPGKFNGGEKVWFWGGVVVLSVIVTWSGLILLFPNFDQTRAVMQDAWIVACRARRCSTSPISFGHMYLGTIGLEGSYQAMRTGYVDETWAKEHHEYWFHEMKASPALQPPGGAVPAGAPHMKEKLMKPFSPLLAAGLLRRASSPHRMPSCRRRRRRATPRRRPRPTRPPRPKAKEATDLGKAQDKAVANYNKASRSLDEREEEMRTCPDPRSPHLLPAAACWASAEGRSATANLQPTKGNKAAGKVTFTQSGDKVKVSWRSDRAASGAGARLPHP